MTIPSKDTQIHTAAAASTDQPAAFDYGGIKEEFHNLLVATGNKLEREWPKRYENAGRVK